MAARKTTLPAAASKRAPAKKTTLPAPAKKKALPVTPGKKATLPAPVKKGAAPKAPGSPGTRGGAAGAPPWAKNVASKAVAAKKASRRRGA
ncbi:hypothetical protein [Streptomyces himalayensis]|uniref:Uncharacterized protein n=1 Tax=Streptomyces himalayensis subsp. himalayensis TaxID=2756131 RepID=A0A7W0IDN2_9ACTN|nr:hypothetical protein [Streptomyces himalayensis]MBA2951439.1 hypothetical protein [Streptomyces himalayensis subsp. himalayensis]